MNRHTLRQHFRQQRRQLNQQQQQHAAKQLVQQCLSLPAYQQALHLAFYLAADGELDAQALIQACWQAGKSVYLPVLHPFTSGHLLFVRYSQDSQMRANCYGIAEPVLRCMDIGPLAQLDIIFTPLVAFDSHGNRLGMGGGFYDRTLAPIQRGEVDTKIIGLAHDCQHSAQLPVQNWDIPLQQIITPSRIWNFDR